jgi:arylsulfatase A-like enzyme
MDLYPTFAYWAGIEVPGDRVIDGKNIAPLITGRPGAVSPHEAFLYFNGPGTVENDTVQQVPPHAIRMGEWKYYFDEGGCGNDPCYEHPYPRQSNTLYNLTEDIAERNDLASQYPDKVREMKAKADEMFAEIKANARPVGRFDENNWSQTEHECPGMTSIRRRPSISTARPVQSRHSQGKTFNLSGETVRPGIKAER